jgi:hypothetical protein
MRPIRLKGYPPALPIWSRGDGSSQAGPGLRPSGHSRCKCSLRLPASTGLRPILAFALRAIRCANVRSGLLPPQDSGPSWPSPSGPFALRMFAPASCLHSRTLRVRLPRYHQAKQEKRPPCGGLSSCLVEVAGVLRPVPAFALRAIRVANVRSGILPPQSNPAGSPPAIPSSETRKKATLRRPFFLFGGGGGSRTRVRRRLTPSTTCLAHRSISSSGSTACETHRSTSLKSFAILPSDGGIRLSHDNDGTSTSIGTSGFPAYALSGECVVVVVGN